VPDLEPTDNALTGDNRLVPVSDAVRSLTADEAVANIFLDQDARNNPAPFYHHLRNTAPVHRTAIGSVFLTRYDDCREALRDNRLGKAAGGPNLLPVGNSEVRDFRIEQQRLAREQGVAVSMLFLNPPHHTRQRSLVSRAFTPRRVEQLRASIRELADEHVDHLVEAGECDLLDVVGFPFPVAVIGTMVGVPKVDWPPFRELITTSAGGIEPTATIEELKASAVASAEVRSYFADLLEQRRAHPADDLLSDLLQVEDAGDQLSDAEIIAVVGLLFAAGFETTTNLIGNGIGALLLHPDEQTRLWDDPSLVPTAVDEMLRWDSPVQLDARSVLEPTSIAGETLEVGERVVTLLGAANRDPSHFVDPDRFDVARSEGPPMSFASGIHYCLGANLSRAEGQEVVASMIERCSTIELTGPLVQRNRLALRGYNEVPIRVTPR
jgi:cytochrome P450